MWLAHAVARSARHHPDRDAVVDEQVRLTHRELHERAGRLAAGLAQAGVAPRDRVALLSPNRAEVVEAYAALSRLGATAVPLNHALTAGEVAEQLGAVGARAVLGDAEVLDALPGGALPEVVLDLGGEDHQRFLRTPADPPPADVGPDDCAIVLFTSATTGRAKGAAVSQGALRASTLHWLAGTSTSAESTMLTATPLYHSTVTIAFAYLAAGATVATMRRFTPQRCLETIEAERATDLYLVPSMVGLCLEARGIEDTDLSSVRQIVHGAAPMPLALRARAAEAFGAALRDCYGQAEAGGPITLLDELRDFTPPPEGERSRATSVGRPLPGVELRVVDEDGAPVPPGALGDVLVRSASLMTGYLDNPEATAETLHDGWLRTGDIGTVDEAGYLHLSDRRSDLIIRGGQNVYPAEVEAVLADDPAVREAAVVGRADDRWGEVPVAFVVPADPRSDDEVAERLPRLVRERLAGFKRPVAFRTLDELPRNPAGKVLKKVLREQVDHDEEEARDAAPAGR